MENRICIEHILIIKGNRAWTSRARSNSKDHNCCRYCASRPIVAFDSNAVRVQKRGAAMEHIEIVPIKPTAHSVSLMLHDGSFVTQQVLHPHAMFFHRTLNARERAL